jgi:hypothetical protein
MPWRPIRILGPYYLAFCLSPKTRVMDVNKIAVDKKNGAKILKSKRKSDFGLQSVNT